MGKSFLAVLLFLSGSVCVCWCSKAQGGKFTGPHAIQQSLYLPKDATQEEMETPTVSCRALSLYKGATINLRMKPNAKKPVNVTVVVSILKAKCANFKSCSYVTDKQYTGFLKNMTGYKFTAKVDTKPETLIGPVVTSENGGDEIQGVASEGDDGESEKGQVGKGGSDKQRDTKDKGTSTGEGGGGPKTTTSAASATAPTPIPTAQLSTSPPTTGPPSQPSAATETAATETQSGEYKTNESGLFIVYIQTWVKQKEKQANLTFDLEMRNTYGYLGAIDYPALVFYSLMFVVYIVLGLAWSVSMCCSYKDLVRLQFWVFGVIILGFLEKVFFVSEYGSINEGEQPSMLILLAEVISAVKRALARVLLIIVCLGFGTVIPRLGDSLMKVIAAGVIYCVLALIDGIVRSRTDTFDTDDRTPLVTMAILFFMDSFIFYWAITSLISVRRALRLRKNYVKLAMYNHFAYTLIFSLFATIAFTVWLFVEVNFPKAGCLEDWQEVWLRDCFWHFLFVIVLIVIMIIWRPSANRNRFAYSLVNDLDRAEEEEDEGMENKNFETVKMRSVSRGDAGTPPPISSNQAEDDLRWVEENLPTTAMDKALPLILDSDEEEMSTKFEVSKMN